MSIIINFFKQNFFIFEIFLSYIPYIFLLKPGKSCWKKLLACIVGCVLFSLVLPAIRTGNEVFNNIIVMLSFLALVAVTVVALKLCFKDSWLALILCGISAYATQHIFFRIRTLTLIILKRID